MISPSIDANADSDIMPAPRRKTLARKKTMTTQITIKRIEAPELQGNPKCGNLATQAMTYNWQVFVNGAFHGTQTRLKDAKDLASYFDKAKVSVVR